MSEQVAAPAPLRVLEPSKNWTGLDFGELWRFRDLLLVLAWRNVLVRYKQTFFGIAWAVIQPVFMMVAFTLFFGKLAGLDHKVNGFPYQVFTYTALLPWTFFSTSLNQTAQSMVGNSNMLRKIYFPRLILPVAAVITALVDFAIAFGVLGVLMVFYHVYPDPIKLLLLPPLILLAFITALGLGLFLAAANVAYRDIGYVLPFIVQIWLFATPIVYDASHIREPYRTIIGLNPMSGVVEGFRWSLLNYNSPPGWPAVVSAGVAVCMLVFGVVYFGRAQRTFADIV